MIGIFKIPNTMYIQLYMLGFKVALYKQRPFLSFALSDRISPCSHAQSRSRSIRPAIEFTTNSNLHLLRMPLDSSSFKSLAYPNNLYC